MSTMFYLIGDDISTAQSVTLDSKWKIEDVKRAVGAVFNVAAPLGLTFHHGENEQELSLAEEILSAVSSHTTPIGLRVDGQAVQSPQGPEGLPLVGSFYEIFPDHLGNHYRLFRKYGHVIKTTNMGKTTYLTDSPELAAVALAESVYMTRKINENHPLWGVKDNTAIFIGDTETENWRLAHKFLPPAMGPKAVRHYTPLMQECVRQSFAVFDELDSCGKSWNAYQYMVKLASQTIGKFSLGTDFEHFTDVDAPLHPIVTNITSLLSLNKKITSRGEWYRHLPFGDPARLRVVQRTIYTLLQAKIDLVKGSGIDGMPMNQAAVEASCVVNYLLNTVDETGQKFPEGLIVANMLIVTGAGFTTTSALMSWLLYCLVTYEGAQDRLYEELCERGVANTEKPIDWTPEFAHSLSFLDCFIKETKRLHNASFQPGRTTKTEVVLPGGYRLPPDSVIVPNLYSIHTNPEVWRDPFRFDPDYWTGEETKNKHRCAYIPFATGPRGCIGFNFALLEVKILLSELVSRYEFTREGLEAIEYDPEFQLIRPLNFYVRAKKRPAAA
ncbi:Cytochrome P450 [Penicillium expansum]|uniref:Cytochrome P450 n=1 Tax=Penicillium expansum TaxID=27334 RepID=A0A0A2JKA0_PENEN|nr:Cytochrome P450 [Penicillium expansum]KGO43669.1 Cytochrome P450 [Penicillium expansum]KGO52695.1 Cytochrome P450 [Penicillium expansum]KGO57838.1 Cytochrome P450 [Penicillium expansum]